MYRQHIIVDLEMNPIDKEHRGTILEMRSETIEIGAVRLNSKLEKVDTFRCFIKPEYSRGIDSSIVRLTGIRNNDVLDALSFSQALSAFSNWVGDSEGTRIYSWSDTDLLQLRHECEFKQLDFPENLKRWLNFQKIYPRIMKISKRKRKLSLKDAARYYGIEMDPKQQHGALYDAEITAQLLIPALNGEYIKQAECVTRYTAPEKSTSMGTLGDKFGDLLRQFMSDSSGSDFCA